MKLLPKVAELLEKRGIAGGGIHGFLNPDLSELPDPLSLRGMKEAAARIKSAAENNESILIFGDYDADGVCSSAILFLYLKSLGAKVNAFIPDRGDGYGLSVETIERAAEEFSPDLFITCDCGVSCAAEAAYVLDLGIDIIVTDHHEPPENLPECTVVNPKISGQNAYCHFSGAGVAFLLVAALGGMAEACKYIDIAAVATVADMVPLTGCNRVVAALGLKEINANPRPAFKALLSAAEAAFPVTSSDLTFKLAPRLNSAGRMGRAGRAFDLLAAESAEDIEALTRELEEANELRKTVSETLYGKAIDELKKNGSPRFSPFISFIGGAEDKGVSGIVAARLANRFSRPAIVMCANGDGTLRGAARGAEGVNLYALLSSASEFLIEFGGHTQAAGFTVREENLPAFYQRIAGYLKNNGQRRPAPKYDVDIGPKDITAEFVRQLAHLEPFGTGNPTPRFRLTVNKTTAQLLKKGTPHVMVCPDGGTRLTGFNSAPLLDLYNSAAQKELIVELSISEFRGAEEISAIIRGTDCARLGADLDGEKSLCRYIEQYTAHSAQRTAHSGGQNKKDNHPVRSASAPPEEGNAPAFAPHSALGAPRSYNTSQFSILNSQFDKLVDLFKQRAADSRWGTIVLSSRYESYIKFLDAAGDAADGLLHEYSYCINPGNPNRIVLAPAFDFEPSFYHTVIFLDPPFAVELADNLSAAGCAVYISADGGGSIREKLSAALDLSRESMGKYYRVFISTPAAPADVYEHYALASEKFAGLGLVNFFAARAVFAELGLISFTDGKLVVEKNVKTELSNSFLYRKLLQITNNDTNSL